MNENCQKNKCFFELPLFPDTLQFHFDHDIFEITFKEEPEHGCCKKVFTCSKRFRILLKSCHMPLTDVGFIIVCDGKIECECIDDKQEKSISTREPICVTVMKKEMHSNCRKIFRKCVCHEEELLEFIVLKTQ